MNAGIISTRYAKAFLKYVSEAGAGEQVYSQACVLVRVMNGLPQMKAYMESLSDISVSRKIELMSAALSCPVEASIVRFLEMVTDRHRVEYFPRMMLAFIELYRQENGIKVGHIVTAAGNEGLRENLEHIFHDRTGARVYLEEKVSPDIMGGFIFELDGCRIDASVRNHLDRIRRQLVEKNNRIV